MSYIYVVSRLRVKTEYLSVGSDIQNIKFEHHIEIMGSRSFRYLGSIFMKCGM
jgi:hypothetical protein